MTDEVRLSVEELIVGVDVERLKAASVNVDVAEVKVPAASVRELAAYVYEPYVPVSEPSSGSLRS